MKDVRLTVRIHKPIQEVFEFTTNPENTPRWIDSVVKEKKNSEEITLGTVYQNWNAEGEMNEYVVTQYQPPHIFQVDATHQDYKLRYTYTSLSEDETELEYFEWSESDQLHALFMREILDKLKEVMEKGT
ncbi:MAG: hypothetical protein JWL75_156 [Parcubacteria group bacterium]|nr:hypothetical protein [Parcubacteria group bacterium]